MSPEDIKARGRRLTVTGTHDGVPLYGLPATGERMQISVVDISRINPDGKFVQRWTLADQLALISQLGMLAAGEPAWRAS